MVLHPNKKDALKLLEMNKVDDETARELRLNGLLRLILGFKRQALMRKIKQKSATYQYHLMQPDGAMLAEVKRMVEEGEVKAILDDQIFTFDDAIDALLHQKSARAKGKIILRMQ